MTSIRVHSIMNVTLKFFVDLSPIWQPVAILVSLFHNIHDHFDLLCFHEKFTYIFCLGLSTMECVSIEQKKANLLNIVNIMLEVRTLGKSSFGNL